MIVLSKCREEIVVAKSNLEERRLQKHCNGKESYVADTVQCEWK